MLSRPEIIDYLKTGKLKITPSPSENQIAQVSIDLRIDNVWTKCKPRNQTAHITSITIEPSLWSSYDIWEKFESKTYTIQPGEFILAQTYETVEIPHDLVAWVEGRSSFARVGLSVHITAPKIDPGFRGHITLEIKNVGVIPITLRAHQDMPVQILFMRLSKPLAHHEMYGSKDDDIFQDQKKPIPDS